MSILTEATIPHKTWPFNALGILAFSQAQVTVTGLSFTIRLYDYDQTRKLFVLVEGTTTGAVNYNLNLSAYILSPNAACYPLIDTSDAIVGEVILSAAGVLNIVCANTKVVRHNTIVLEIED